MISYKDILLEFRTKEIFFSFLLFAFLLIVLLAFSIPEKSAEHASFIYWISFLFAGITGISKVVTKEMEGGGFQGLLTLPVERGTIFLGKTISLSFFSFISGFLLYILFVIFMNLSFNFFFPFIVLIFLVSIGFSSLGVLFSFLSYPTKAKEFMMPLLLIPLFIPLFISAVQITEKILKAEKWGNSLFFLIFFDLLFLSLCNLLFEYAVLE